MKNLTWLVSVDTNTINWTRSQDYPLSTKWNYIPNFVDLSQFSPAAGKMPTKELVVLYPRRLYEARGFWLLAKQIPHLLRRCPNLVFHFVGKADLAEEVEVKHLEKVYPGKVKWFNYPPHEMPKAYQEADITVIPTLYSEGTSLSCLEALACKNAVIATTVGGLPDLIIPGHNGMLVKPDGDAISQAIVDLVNDASLRARLAETGYQTAHAFRIEVWQDRWKVLLTKMLPSPEQARVPRAQVVVPDAGGVDWVGIKQRPHHIARQFAEQGKEVYWIDPKPERGISDADHIHILGNQDEICFSRPWVYIYYPYNYARIKDYDNARIIYDILDDVSIHDESDRIRHVPHDHTARYYADQLLKRADIVITSSSSLYDEVKKVRPDVVLVPNGISLTDFSPGSAVIADKIKKIRELHKPVIGFHGAVANWIDADLLEKVIRSRPEYQFVFIGPVSDPAAPHYLHEPNVTSIGAIQYEQVQNHIAGFDVEIIPFKLNPITRGVRPLKALETLAMHKPVISTRLPEIATWPGILFGDDAAGFASAIDAALQKKWDTTTIQKVDQFVAENTWQNAVKPLLSRMDSHREV
ncbi:MAG TPA: glycosyltransferase, partial [Longilinea sp.]|nr:glycosyltransferase [Longilinea sp.]